MLQIRNTVFGGEKPLMAVSLTGTTMEEIAAQCREAVRQQADIIEWRADYYLATAEDLERKLLESDIYFEMLRIMDVIEKTAGDRPRIFTIRTRGQGGAVELSNASIEGLQEVMAQSGLADIIDVEVRGYKSEYGGIGGVMLKERIDMLRREGAGVMLSYHDHAEMIPPQDIVRLVAAMSKYGADMYKVAAMASTMKEADGLLRATGYISERLEAPIVTMAMGMAGRITRVAGGKYGSVMTFAALGEGSAPGQLPAEMMREKLDQIYGA